MLAGDSLRVSMSLRQAMTCARVTVRNSAGSFSPAKVENSDTSILYARRVFLLVMLASHSSSGGTSASSPYWAGVRVRKRTGIPPEVMALPALFKLDNVFYRVRKSSRG